MTSQKLALWSRLFSLDTSRNVKILLGAAFLVTFGVFMVQPYLIARLPAYVGLSSEAISRYFMIAALAGSSLALLWSLFAERINVVGMTRFSASALVLSFVLLELAGKVHSTLTVVALFFGFFLFRFSLSLLRTCTFSLYSLSTDDSASLPRIFALSTSLVAIGGTTGPLLAGFLTSFEDILLASILVLSFAAFAILFLEPEEARSQPPKEPKKSKLSMRAFRPATLGVAVSSMAIYLLIAQNFSYLPVVITTDYAQSANAMIAKLFALKAVLLAIFPLFLTKFLESQIDRLSYRYLFGLISALVGISIFTSFHAVPFVPYLSMVFLSIGEMVAGTYSQVLISKTVEDADDLPAAMGLLTFTTLALGIGVGQYLGIYILGFASSWHLLLWVAIVIGGILALRFGMDTSQVVPESR
jgi:MFS family permease